KVSDECRIFAFDHSPPIRRCYAFFDKRHDLPKEAPRDPAGLAARTIKQGADGLRCISLMPMRAGSPKVAIHPIYGITFELHALGCNLPWLPLRTITLRRHEASASMPAATLQSAMRH